MEEILNNVYFGNTVLSYIIALAIFVGGVVVVYIFKTVILKRLKKWAEKTATTVDDFIIHGIQKSVVPVLYFVVLRIAVQTLSINPTAQKVINIASIVVVTFYAIRLITSTLKYAIDSYIQTKENAEERGKRLRVLHVLASAIVWGFGIVFLLDNLGFEISAVVTGLGIGGIAVALAAQAVMGDFFSYFVIVFDRPFELGDFLIVGDKKGVVEYIGIKTTRLKALGGEQLIFANKDLTDSRVHNYKRMQKRRVSFGVGVVYQTKPEHLKMIPDMVKGFIESVEDTEFDRAHFASYGDSSLNFEFIYYVIGNDYTKYMNIQQEINLKIFEEFNKQGIEFAYPTRTLFLNKENGEDEKDKPKAA